MRAGLVLLAAAVGVGLSGTAAAQTAPAPGAAAPKPGAPPSGEVLYRERTCIACHGADAKTPILPDYPKLAGQNPAYLLRQAQDIKSGARSNGNTAAMKGVMHLVNDDELRAIAEWLASLAP
jgi:cytochrome c